MYNMIKGYSDSCILVKKRINQLTEQRNKLKKQGDICTIKELDLERRIKLLYCEYGQMQEIIIYLNSCMRRRELSGDT